MSGSEYMIKNVHGNTVDHLGEAIVAAEHGQKAHNVTVQSTYSDHPDWVLVQKPSENLAPISSQHASSKESNLSNSLAETSSCR